MKKLILLFIACFICVNASAMEQVTDVNIKKNLADNLTKTGKNCSKCIDAYVLSKDNEKNVYKVICIDRVEPYIVTATPTGEFESEGGKNFLEKAFPALKKTK